MADYEFSLKKKLLWNFSKFVRLRKNMFPVDTWFNNNVIEKSSDVATFGFT